MVFSFFTKRQCVIFSPTSMFLSVAKLWQTDFAGWYIILKSSAGRFLGVVVRDLHVESHGLMKHNNDTRALRPTYYYYYNIKRYVTLLFRYTQLLAYYIFIVVRFLHRYSIPRLGVTFQLLLKTGLFVSPEAKKKKKKPRCDTTVT